MPFSSNNLLESVRNKNNQNAQDKKRLMPYVSCIVAFENVDSGTLLKTGWRHIQKTM